MAIRENATRIFWRLYSSWSAEQQIEAVELHDINKNTKIIYDIWQNLQSNLLSIYFLLHVSKNLTTLLIKNNTK